MPDNTHLTVEWIDMFREPPCSPDPSYPNGIDIDFSFGAVQTCKADLPYPAERCGFYKVSCSRCGNNFVITTAGRRDDPRSLKMSCRTGLDA